MMFAFSIVLCLLSCILSDSFYTPAFRLKNVSGFQKLLQASSDASDISKVSDMTIVEKERDFQNTLDKLLLEARANNALSGKAEGEDFTDEEIAIAAAELKQLKFLNSKEQLEKVQVKRSWEIEEDAAPAPQSGGVFKKIAIFGALTIVFAAILLPIIDKIFPDPPSIESSITSK